MVVVCFDEAAAQGFGEHCRDGSANLQEKKRGEIQLIRTVTASWQQNTRMNLADLCYL
jgi:hypothetical protein